MPILQKVQFEGNVYGDGSSVIVTINLEQAIQQNTVMPKNPLSLILAQVSGYTVSSSSLVGRVVSMTLTSAIANGSTAAYNIVLGF